MKIVSWNVNGLAICRRKGFLKFLSNFNPDIICCQEIKSPCSLNTPGYLPFWYPATRKNYSGTLVLSKLEPLSVAYGLGLRGMDEEGRAITLEYEDYFIINAYFPNLNPHSAPNRPEYRRKWESALRTHIKRLHKPVVLCGDFNVAHAYIDIYPDNQKNTPEEPIFLPEQRAGLDKLFALGLIDVFRSFYPTLEGAYTWWGPRPKSRERNLGSRLDYFLVSECLLEFVRNIQHITDIQMSDHCPILLSLSPVTYHPKTTDEDLAVQWRSADFKQLKGELQKKQREISYAAYKQRWGRVQVLQDELTSSYAARMLAVKTVIDKNSAAGVDHVKWKTDVQAMRAAISLTSRNYRALPYRHLEIELDGKIHIIHVPAAKDKAMLTLYAYALDPVSEATADKKSFFSRKGRSHFDFHANILAAFQGENPPAWVVVCDVKSFYSNVVHEWLFANIPMDTNVLREFLRAGVIKDGDLFDTTQGISKGAALSSILGNMILDGLQPFIYDRLYPKGNANFQNGNLIRFCDDIIITATSKTSAQLILQVVGEFLAERGLSFNWEKTHITHIENGFEVLSRRYQRISGILTAHPSKRAVAEFEREMEGLILNFKGTQRDLIDKINQKLTGFATYHRVTDAFHAFRRIDTTVNGLLIRRMCDHYKRWSQDAVLSRFWINDGGDRIFALPDDPTVRVAQLAPLGIVFHRTCKADFNPYLDEKYFQWLQSRRAVQKATGIYGAIWSRQGGRCAYCKQQMLPDQEVRVVEKIIGRGHTARNLQYIHERCAFDTYSAAGEGDGEGVDLFELLDDIVRREPRKEPPYLELREYFRLSQKPAFTLTFKQIERILGDHLPWEAYFHKAFWYEETPNLSSLLWENESFPMEYFSPSEPDYCISDSWISQGYKIKTLYLESRRVVFRQEIKNTTGFIPPKALTRTRLDDELNYKLQQILKKFIKEHGL